MNVVTVDITLYAKIKFRIVMEWIAKRDLKFSLKGSEKRHNLSIQIGKPYLLKKGMVDFLFAEGTAGCTVEFKGIFIDYVYEGQNHHEVYGADSLQALELAVDIDPTLRRLSKKYNFFFPTGESYFDED